MNTSSQNLQKQQVDFSYTSFSRIESFKKCSEYYHKKYIKGEEEIKPFNKYLAIGQLVHSTLAEYLDEVTSSSKFDAFYFHLGPWLDEVGVHKYDPDDLLEYVMPAADLLWRASEKCKDERAIRKENGELLSDPSKYPNKEFKRLCSEEGITERFATIDNTVCKENEAFIEESFCWIISKAYFLAISFEVPDWVKENTHVELGFSTNNENKVLIPNTNTALRGYIDWIVRLEDGRLLLLDHKTSRKKPSAEEVFLHPQLNIYAWLYEKIYGVLPELIGINHLESGEYIVVQTNRTVVGSFVDYYSELQQSIEKGIHFKHDPNEYNTPCLKRNWKSNKVIESCPFLAQCHPIFHHLVKEEL